MRALPALLTLPLLAACGGTPDSGAADPVPIHGRPGAIAPAPAAVAETSDAERLLAADREFAARSLAAGAPAAFHAFMDERGMQLPAGGKPLIGRDQVRDALAQGPTLILSWEPRYAELLSSDWGWTWGEWQAHEPGAGGRRVGQGRYMNLWKKQPDGSWKVRLDMGNTEPRKEP